MKRFLTICLLTILSFALISCAPNCRFSGINVDLTKENWQCLVNRNPNFWLGGATRWFVRGVPSYTEIHNRRAPLVENVSTATVRVASFSQIKANGNFKLQIFQTEGHESVIMYGPHAGMRGISVGVRNGTLCIEQPLTDCPYDNRVIVRVGIRNLRSLVQMGRGTIEAANIKSCAPLYIATAPGSSGNIYLSGCVNLRCIEHKGAGCIIVLGADTPLLTINTCGGGSVNLAGNVGIRSIVHHGIGNVNIIGANSDNLRILADGEGKIGIDGHVNVKKIEASDCAGVYINGVDSNYIYVYACNKAIVGLSGYTCDLYVSAGNNAMFLGRYLCANNAYVKTCECAHINVSTTNRIFASARNNSSVYFFGSPNALSQFVSGNGVVIPIYGVDVRSGCCRPRRSLKGEGCAPPPACPRPCPKFVGAG